MFSHWLDSCYEHSLEKKSNGVSFQIARKKHSPSPCSKMPKSGQYSSNKEEEEGLTFVYPYGASITVQAPSCPILSTGPTSYPVNHPIAGVWQCPVQDRYSAPQRQEGSESNTLKGPGRLLILGSMEIFGDIWIDEEENRKLCDVLFQWLLNDSDIALEEQVH